MLHDRQQHHPCMTVADVSPYIIWIQHITPDDAYAIAWVEAINDSGRVPREQFEQTMQQLKQRFEVVLLTINRNN